MPFLNNETTNKEGCINMAREVEVIHDGDGSGGAAGNAIWALALILIVAMIVGVVYYSGILRTSPTKKIDVEVSAPRQ